MANSQADNKTKVSDDLRDKNLASEERPVPSQAEGDLQTVDQDLEINKTQPKTLPRTNLEKK